MSPAGSDFSAGFTLVETLVAFVIVALSLQLAFQIFSVQTQNYQLAHAQRRAVSLADNLLASVGTEIPLRPATIEGSFDDGYRFTIVLKPHLLGEREAKIGDFALFEIDLRVAWGAAAHPKIVSLKSLRLGAYADD